MGVRGQRQLLEESHPVCVLQAKIKATKAPFKVDPGTKDLWSHCLVPGPRIRCVLPPARTEVALLLFRKGNLSLGKL